MTRNEKFYFAAETKVVEGITVRRIRALVDIPNAGVEAGDLGGWLEKPRNLSWYGASWVGEDGVVTGECDVTDSAIVRGNASLFGSVKAAANTLIGGQVKIHGDYFFESGATIMSSLDLLTVGPIGPQHEIAYMYRTTAGYAIPRSCVIHTNAAEFLETMRRHITSDYVEPLDNDFYYVDLDEFNFEAASKLWIVQYEAFAALVETRVNQWTLFQDYSHHCPSKMKEHCYHDNCLIR